ncbi:hypothetical protein [Bacillus cereus]
MKRFMGITLASAIGFSGLGVFDTSFHASVNTNDVAINQMVKVEDMSIKQLQEATQQKNDPFIN